MPPRFSASEFPNDNPELHDGLVWACPAPCARPLPTLRLRAVRDGARVLGPSWEAMDVSADEAPADEAPADEAPADDPSASGASETTPSHAFGALLRALSAVLLELGATRAAASVPALFGEGRLPPDAFDAGARSELAACGILEATSGRPTARFSATALAWRGVLDGTNGDLSACGATGLDAFCAELVAAAAGLGAERREGLRRALRARGVAAFGVLAAA